MLMWLTLSYSLTGTPYFPYKLSLILDPVVIFWCFYWQWLYKQPTMNHRKAHIAKSYLAQIAEKSL